MEVFYWSYTVARANERIFFWDLLTKTDSTGGVLVGKMTKSFQVVVCLNDIRISDFGHFFDFIMSIFRVTNKLNKFVLSSSDQNSIALMNLSLLIDKLINELIGKC